MWDKFYNNIINIMSGKITNIPWKNNQQMWLTFPDVNHENFSFQDKIFKMYPVHQFCTQLYKIEKKSSVFS